MFYVQRVRLPYCWKLKEELVWVCGGLKIGHQLICNAVVVVIVSGKEAIEIEPIDSIIGFVNAAKDD